MNVRRAAIHSRRRQPDAEEIWREWIPALRSSTAIRRAAILCRRLVLLVALALFAGAALAAPVSDAADSLYDSALKALREGREEDALILLNEVLTREPKHAGAWLDLAIAYCDLGHRDRAESIFTYVEAAFDPPAALRQVIEHYRALGCRRSASPTKLALRLYGGHVGNVNQGTGSPFVRFGLPGQTFELQLSDRYLPRSDRAIGSEFTLEHPIAGTQWQAFGGAQLRRYFTERDFDIGFVTGGFARRAQSAGWRFDTQVQGSRLWLGGGAYQTSLGAWASLWGPGEKVRSGAELALTGYRYSQNRAYDSTIADARGKLLVQPGDTSSIQLSAGAQLDRAAGERPGGDRTGPVVQVLAAYAPAARHRIEWAGEWRRLRDRQAYDPLIFEGAVRLQKQQYLLLAWQWNYRGADSVRVEWRRQGSSDSLPVFSYAGNSLMAYWQRIWEIR